TRQLLQRLDFGFVHHLAVHPADGDPELLEILGESGEQFCRRHGILRSRHDQRPGEVSTQALERRALDDAPRQGVFHHLDEDSRLAGLAPDRRQFGNGESPVLGENHRLGAGDGLRNLGDHRLFLCETQAHESILHSKVTGVLYQVLPDRGTPPAQAGRAVAGWRPDPLSLAPRERRSAPAVFDSPEMAGTTCRPFRTPKPVERRAAALPRTVVDQMTSSDVRSTRTPGPIVVDRVTRLMNWPLAVDGLALTSEANSASRFSLSASGSNDALPMVQ